MAGARPLLAAPRSMLCGRLRREHELRERGPGHVGLAGARHAPREHAVEAGRVLCPFGGALDDSRDRAIVHDRQVARSDLDLDARALQLVLIGGRTGGEVYGHDWEYLLNAMGIAYKDHAIASAVQATGAVTMFAAIVWGVRVVLRSPRRK